MHFSREEADKQTSCDERFESLPNLVKLSKNTNLNEIRQNSWGFLYEMQMWFTFYKYPKTVERITIT